MDKRKENLMKLIRERWPRKGAPSQAVVRLAKRATRMFPRSPRCWCILGDLLQLEYCERDTSYGPETFLSCYLMAIVIDPAFADAYREIGCACYTFGAYKTAEACLRKALRLQPDVVDSYLYLARVLSESRKRKAAVCLLRKCRFRRDQRIKECLNEILAWRTMSKLETEQSGGKLAGKRENGEKKKERD